VQIIPVSFKISAFICVYLGFNFHTEFTEFFGLKEFFMIKKVAGDEDAASAVRDMLGCDGWKVLEKWIRGQVDAGTADLLICPLEEVPARRSAVRTLRGILCKVRELAELD
jgi:hypothetical protein